jgi:mannose-6-phosphate isomerase-like protein (cupin superfamily)
MTQNYYQMNTQNLTIIDITQEAITNEAYKNIPVASVNDHVVRMGVMTEPYFWHLHPESDESFLVIEGSIFIDLEDKTVELFPNQLFTIPKNVIHRTRPNGNRSVNLTFESSNMTTVRVENLSR